MTPDERAAAEAALNTMISNAFQIGIALFAIGYFGHKAWVKWGAPLLALFLSPRAHYVAPRESFPVVRESAGNVHSQAQEPIRNAPVPVVSGTVPGDAERPFTLDELLTELARIQVVHRDGKVGPLAQDRIVALIGGRREETIAAIKVARGEVEPEPEPSKDPLRVRDSAGERLIAR